MLKKAKAAAARDAAGDAGERGADTQGKAIADGVLESSRQIWLAGLGAFARAKGEGAKMFEALVEQGQSLESRTRAAAAGTASAAREAAQAKAKEMQAKAGGTWDKLEQVFEDRVARALSRLGVHTQADVTRLTERVDALSEAVNRLIRTSGGVPVSGSNATRAAKRKRTRAGAGDIAPAAGSKRAAKSAKSARRTAGAAPDAVPAAAAPRTPRKTARRKAKAAGTR